MGTRVSHTRSGLFRRDMGGARDGYTWISHRATGDGRARRCERGDPATQPRALSPRDATAASTSTWFRPFTITSAPNPTNSRAVASPMPFVLPVISTLYPSRRHLLGIARRDGAHEDDPFQTREEGKGWVVFRAERKCGKSRIINSTTT